MKFKFMRIWVIGFEPESNRRPRDWQSLALTNWATLAREVFVIHSQSDSQSEGLLYHKRPSDTFVVCITKDLLTDYLTDYVSQETFWHICVLRYLAFHVSRVDFCSVLHTSEVGVAHIKSWSVCSNIKIDLCFVFYISEVEQKGKLIFGIVHCIYRRSICYSIYIRSRAFCSNIKRWVLLCVLYIRSEGLMHQKSIFVFHVIEVEQKGQPTFDSVHCIYQRSMSCSMYQKSSFVFQYQKMGFAVCSIHHKWAFQLSEVDLCVSYYRSRAKRATCFRYLTFHLSNVVLLCVAYIRS